MTRHGNLIVVSGPAGAGKGTLVARLLDRVQDAWVSVSATTRAPRPAEIDGVSYFFLSDEEFDSLVAEDGFLEWAHVHVNKYGTPKKSVLEAIDAGKQVILEIDVQGALQVKDIFPAAHLIFICPPSMEVLEARLRGRGTEPEDVIAARMKVAEVELAQKSRYDYTVVNDDLDRATDELVALVERLATEEG